VFNGFATLDRAHPVDPVEGFTDQFSIEFRTSAGRFVERLFGSRQHCIAGAELRGFPPNSIRVTGRARQ
jgi:hypothetical protein